MCTVACSCFGGFTAYLFAFYVEGTQILNSNKYFTGLSSLAEKIVIVEPRLTGELG